MSERIETSETDETERVKLTIDKMRKDGAANLTYIEVTQSPEKIPLTQYHRDIFNDEFNLNIIVEHVNIERKFTLLFRVYDRFENTVAWQPVKVEKDQRQVDMDISREISMSVKHPHSTLTVEIEPSEMTKKAEEMPFYRHHELE